MKRQFALEPIPWEQYNQVCLPVRVPPGPCPISSNPANYPSINRRRWGEKRYFRMVEMLSYESLCQLIEGIDDDVQQLLFVWPPGHMSSGRAQHLTLSQREQHLRNVIKEEHAIDVLVIGYIKNSRHAQRKQGYYSDRFQFNRENNQWVLRRFHIHRPNYECYAFTFLDHGVRLLHVPAISGIFDAEISHLYTK